MENIDENVSYLIPLSQSNFVNVNPDFRLVGKESKVLNAAFTRLYVLENLPGFKLVYRSPSGEVKIFERTFNTKGNAALETETSPSEADAVITLPSQPNIVNASNTSQTVSDELQNTSNATQNTSE